MLQTENGKRKPRQIFLKPMYLYRLLIVQTKVCRLSVCSRRHKRKLSVCKQVKSTKRTCPSKLLVSRPLLRLMYGKYWFRLSHLSMMVIGSFASYTKTKSVESAVWCLLTLDDDVETGSRIKIPEQSSGSELFFFSFRTTIKTKLKWKWNKIIEQRTK